MPFGTGTGGRGGEGKPRGLCRDRAAAGRSYPSPISRRCRNKTRYPTKANSMTNNHPDTAGVWISNPNGGEPFLEFIGTFFGKPRTPKAAPQSNVTLSVQFTEGDRWYLKLASGAALSKGQTLPTPMHRRQQPRQQRRQIASRPASHWRHWKDYRSRISVPPE